MSCDGPWWLGASSGAGERQAVPLMVPGGWYCTGGAVGALASLVLLWGALALLVLCWGLWGALALLVLCWGAVGIPGFAGTVLGAVGSPGFAGTVLGTVGSPGFTGKLRNKFLKFPKCSNHSKYCFTSL